LPPLAPKITAATVLALEDIAAQSSAGLTPKALGALRVRSLCPATHGQLGALGDILVRMALARNDQSPLQASKVSPARIHRSALLLRALRLPDDDSSAGWGVVLPSARAAWQGLLRLVNPATLTSGARASGSGFPSTSLREGEGGPGP
jgi:hypothetical protein